MEYYWHVIEGSMEFIWYDESDDIKLFDIFVISGGLGPNLRNPPFCPKTLFFTISRQQNIIDMLLRA